MNTPASPDFDLVHRAERVTNISPASDAFVLFTLATLFFTIGCFAVWMWFIWSKGRQRPAPEQIDAEPIARRPDNSDDPKPSAPWEKPPDWWKA